MTDGKAELKIHDQKEIDEFSEKATQFIIGLADAVYQGFQEAEIFQKSSEKEKPDENVQIIDDQSPQADGQIQLILPSGLYYITIFQKLYSPEVFKPFKNNLANLKRENHRARDDPSINWSLIQDVYTLLIEIEKLIEETLHNHPILDTILEQFGTLQETLDKNKQLIQNNGFRNFFIDNYAKSIEIFVKKFAEKILKVVSKFTDLLDSFEEDALNEVTLNLIFTCAAEPLLNACQKLPLYRELSIIFSEAYKKNSDAVEWLLSEYTQIPMLPIRKRQMAPATPKLHQIYADLEEKIIKFTRKANKITSMEKLGFEIGRRFFTFIEQYIESIKEAISQQKMGPTRFQRDCEQLLNDITDYYEYLRYQNGLFLGLFDIMNKGDCHRQTETYFSTRHNTKGGMYSFHRKIWDKEKKKLVLAYNFKNLQSYLAASNFGTLQSIYSSIMEILHKLRLHDAHHRLDIEQDLVDDQKYKIFIDDEYYWIVSFGELYSIKVDITQFIFRIQEIAMLYSIKYGLII